MYLAILYSSSGFILVACVSFTVLMISFMGKDKIIEKNNPQRSVLVIGIFFTCPVSLTGTFFYRSTISD